jgi:hypothetical protein
MWHKLSAAAVMVIGCYFNTCIKVIAVENLQLDEKQAAEDFSLL